MSLQVVGAAIVRTGQVLAARRSYPAEAAGRWEFPGGKVGVGETPEAALTREIAEELGCQVVVEGWLPQVGFGTAAGTDLQLRVALCRLTHGEPRVTEHDALRWLSPEQLHEVDWLEPDRPFLHDLCERLLDGERLLGGNVGGAVRIGDTVRRPVGPWTPAVHALLRHLGESGLPGVPRAYGLDARGREVLDYLPGEVIDVDHEQLNESRLRNLGRWLGALHGACGTFEHAGPWRFFDVAAPTVITHNDVAPYNVCFAGDEVSGVFDWDLAGPSRPMFDLGHTDRSAIPLFREIPATAAARRLHVFAEGYGTDARAALQAVQPRVQLAIDGVREGLRRGDEGMINLAAVGEPERTERALAGFLTRRDAIESAL